MSKTKFVREVPKEGTMTLGVVYHITRAQEIKECLRLPPIGWVVEDLEKEPHREEGQPKKSRWVGEVPTEVLVP